MLSHDQKPAWAVSGFIISLLTWIGLIYFIERAQFGVLIGAFTALFGAYFFIVKAGNHPNVFKWGIIGAILFRLLYIPVMPELSDDVFRFIWDGRLLAQGIDPFRHLPTYFINGAGQNLTLTGINETLFQKLNSPEYYSVYPPFCQAVFTLPAYLFPESITGSTITIRVLLLAFESANFYLIYWLLSYYRLPRYLVLLYALNPLVITEITGNLHFEGIMVTGLLGAWVLLCQNRFYWSAMAFALSVLTKLIPLMFLPLLIRRIGFWPTLGYGTIVGVITSLGFLTVSSWEQLAHMLQSVELYFQTFEFNASFYYIFRWIGYQLEGYNMIATIGKILPVLTVLIIGLYTWLEQKPDLKRLPLGILFILFIYLLLSTTVHPWYIVTLLPFALFTRFRFPFLWSFLAVLSYAAYAGEPFETPTYLLWIEYTLILAMALLEWQLPGLFKTKTFQVFST